MPDGLPIIPHPTDFHIKCGYVLLIRHGRAAGRKFKVWLIIGISFFGSTFKSFSLLVNHEIANKTKKLTFFKEKHQNCSFGNEKSLDLFHKEQSLEVFPQHTFGFM